MPNLDLIKELAREALIISTPDGGTDSWLWQCSERIVRNIELICQLPELADPNLQINRFSLMAAGYFCQAEGEVITEALTDILEAPAIRNINRIIEESNDHLTKMIEAMILADARGLDDMGAAGVFGKLRQYISNGKSLADAFNSWEKKIDYGYWQNRLEKGFNFDQTRQVAKRRLDFMEEYMSQLKLETKAGDLKAILTNIEE